MTDVTFTAVATSGSVTTDRYAITIGNTIYNVTPASGAANTANAIALAAAINAGTQAYATNPTTTTVKITLKDQSLGEKILVQYYNSSAWANVTLTVNSTTGGTVQRLFKATSTVSAGASFTMDRVAQFDGYYLGGTSATLNTGIVTGALTVGIKLVSYVLGGKNDVAVYGGLQGEDIIYTTNPSYGSGTSLELTDAEVKANTMSRMYTDLGYAFPDVPTTNVVTNERYDMVTITYRNVLEDLSAMRGTTSHEIHLQIALPNSDNAPLGNSNTDTPSYALFSSSGYLNLWANGSPKAFPKIATV